MNMVVGIISPLFASEYKGVFMGARILANRYELLDKIGEGGMAVVFKAKDRLLERSVAVKILRPEFIKDEGFIDSFRRESQLVAGIVDKNIVTVYDVGQQGNIYYIVMEYIEGEVLSEIIKREGKLDAKRTASYGNQIAMALCTAHKNNLIHRDIKPHNIMVTNTGIAKLMDFGIAKRVSNDTMLEEKEAVMGSIHYFSPEQARGQHVDERSDIYSLGIVMYEMITGKVPFDGENAVEVAVKHMNEEMVPPSSLVNDVPQDLEDIILKATAKNPDDRYNNAEEMITDLNFIKFSRIAEPKEGAPILQANDQAEEEDDSNMKVLAHHTRSERAVQVADDEQSNTGKESKKKSKKGKSDDDQDSKKKPFNLAALLFVVLAIVLSFPVSKVIANKIVGDNKSDDTVSVPHLEDMSYDEAAEYLEKLGLGIEVGQKIQNNDKEEGIVLSYSPSEGTVVKKGQTIKVNISEKTAAKTVPTLSMLDLSAAKIRIQQNGYEVGSVTESYDATIPKGYVIRSNPGSGVKLEKGGTIDLVVSKGVDPSTLTTFTLNLVGLTEEEAIAAILDKNCKYEIKKNANHTVEYGYVYMQTPSASDPIEYEDAENQVFIIYVNNYAGGNTGPDIEKELTLTLSMSMAENDPFDVTVIVTLDGQTPETQYSRVPISKTTEDVFSLDIHGYGKGVATVIIDNKMINYDIDFDNGTVAPTE